MFLLLPSLRTGFLSDDFLDLDHGFSAATFTNYEAGGFRPLLTALWAFDSHVWGAGRAWGWHLTNIVLHLSCAFLLWRIAARLLADENRAAVAAAFFLVSMTAVPSVARVSGRTTPAAMLPLLAAVLAHCR